MPDESQLERSVTILHLSDLQYGKYHRFPGPAGGNPFDTLLERLKLDLADLRTDHGLQPDIVALTGDLAEWGMPAEFEHVAAFIRALREFLGLPMNRMAILPGNHDINRFLCQSHFLECQGSGEQPVKPYAAKWRHYIKLFDEIYGGIPGLRFAPEEPWTLFDYPELKVVVAAMNSTIADSHLEADHYGFLGEPQLRWFAGRLRDYQSKGWLRIAALHHNVREEGVPDNEKLRDADAFASIVGRHVNAVLHGHTHRGRAEVLRHNVPIYATGSAAVAEGARPPEVPNQYQFIRFTRVGVRRWTRAYFADATPPGFGGDNRSSEKRDTWITFEPIEFDRVEAALGEEDAERLSRGIVIGTAEVTYTYSHDDFLARVERVARLRANDLIEIEAFRRNIPLPYLRVSERAGAITRLYPVGAIEAPASTAVIDSFARSTHASYRAVDPGVVSTLVCGGEPPPSPELIQEAARRGIRLQSWIEYQGLIDFRAYVDAQTQRLVRDARYPESLYVPQRIRYSAGGEEKDAGDALSTVADMLTAHEPRFVLILGEFGTGKSFLQRQLALRLAREGRPQPIFVEMRTLEKARTLDELIVQHLARHNIESFDLPAFRYMLEEGRIALLFDGFDELIARVTYPRAADHLETLLQAMRGQAKIVVSSRTQFFESEQQVRSVLREKVELVGGRRIVRLQRFDKPQILAYLTRVLGSEAAAQERMSLLDEITDLMGLSENPRMLSFIAELSPEELERAKSKDGTVTSAELYRVLINRWLEFEIVRAEPAGAAPSLNLDERLDAVTALAVHLWEKPQPTVNVRELGERIGEALGAIATFDLGTATHQVGSGTLLIRDDEGNFSFVHQSVLEWLVANRIAADLNSAVATQLLGRKELSLLMADFLAALATPERAALWAGETLVTEGTEDVLKKNAMTMVARLGLAPPVKPPRFELAGQDLRAQDYSGADLSGATLVKADLSEARLVSAILAGADLTDAKLPDTDLSDADLRGANLTGADFTRARLLGAKLEDAILEGASFRRAKLLGASLDVPSIDPDALLGAAVRATPPIPPVFERLSNAVSVVWSRDDELLASAEAATVRLWDTKRGREIRAFAGEADEAIWRLALDDRATRLAAATNTGRVIVWEAATGNRRWTYRIKHVVALSFDARGSGLFVVSPSHVNLLNVDNGSLVSTVRVRTEIYVARLTDDGHLLYVGRDYRVRSLDLSSGYELEIGKVTRSGLRRIEIGPVAIAYTGPGDLTVLGHDSQSFIPGFPDVAALAIDESGSFVAAMHGSSLILWSASTRTELSRTTVEGEVRNLSFSHDGTRVAIGMGDGRLEIVSVPAGAPVQTFGRRPSTINRIRETGLRAVSIATDDRIVRWDLRTGWAQIHGTGPMFDADPLTGRWASASTAGLLVRSVRGSERMLPLESVQTPTLIAFADYAVAYADGRVVKVYDLTTNRQKAALLHRQELTAMAMTRDGKIVATATEGGRVRIWDVATVKVRETRKRDEDVNSLTFADDGRLVISDRYALTVWAPRTGARVTRLRDFATDAAFSPNGRLVALTSLSEIEVMSADTKKRFWSRRQMDLAATVFAGDSSLLCVLARDATMELFRAADGELLATYALTANGWVSFRPDGRYRAGGDLEGRFGHVIGLCRFDPEELEPYLETPLRLGEDELLVDV